MLIKITELLTAMEARLNARLDNMCTNDRILALEKRVLAIETRLTLGVNQVRLVEQNCLAFCLC